MDNFVGPRYPTVSYVTGVPDNSTYLYKINIPTVTDPFSGSTIGLLMILSTFQYQSPTANPAYSNALGQASKAAYVQVGGQAFQDKVMGIATDKGKNVIHSMGITDGQMGAVLGAYMIARDRRLSLDGPKIYSINTHLTYGVGNANIGFKYEW